MLIAKSGAYGCQEDALVLIESYFTNKQRRSHVNSNFSMWEKIISRVLQGSILGTVLFNIFLNDLLLFVEYCHLSKCQYVRYFWRYPGTGRRTLKPKLWNSNKMVLQILYAFELGQMSFYVAWIECSKWNILYNNTEIKNSKKEKIQ